jgi:hypothetical protein
VSRRKCIRRVTVDIGPGKISGEGGKLRKSLGKFTEAALELG